MDNLVPHESDDPGIIVVIREIVVQGGEALALALFLHLGQLLLIEFRCIEISPVKRRWIHREAGSQRSVSADDDIALSRSTVPVRKANFTAGILNNSGHGFDLMQA